MQRQDEDIADRFEQGGKTDERERACCADHDAESDTGTQGRLAELLGCDRHRVRTGSARGRTQPG